MNSKENSVAEWVRRMWYYKRVKKTILELKKISIHKNRTSYKCGVTYSFLILLSLADPLGRMHMSINFDRSCDSVQSSNVVLKNLHFNGVFVFVRISIFMRLFEWNKQVSGEHKQMDIISFFREKNKVLASKKSHSHIPPAFLHRQSSSIFSISMASWLRLNYCIQSNIFMLNFSTCQ